MNPDFELRDWRADWQTETEVPADLRRRVERGSRRMRLLLAAEVLITLVMGGGSIFWAVVEPRTERRVLSLAIWLFLAAAWTFATLNRRGNWSPSAVSTGEFVDLSIRRCRARLVTVKAGALLYFVEMAFCLTWLYWDPARRQPLAATIFAVITPLFLVGLARYRRKTLEELTALEDLWRRL